MENHDFETILTSNDVMNIQNRFCKDFGSREISYSMKVNDYFGPRLTDRLHATPNYGPETSNFEVDYYRPTYFSPETLYHIRKRLVKEGQK